MLETCNSHLSRRRADHRHDRGRDKAVIVHKEWRQIFDPRFFVWLTSLRSGTRSREEQHLEDRAKDKKNTDSEDVLQASYEKREGQSG